MAEGASQILEVRRGQLLALPGPTPAPGGGQGRRPVPQVCLMVRNRYPVGGSHGGVRFIPFAYPL